jgi:hypothetical protein
MLTRGWGGGAGAGIEGAATAVAGPGLEDAATAVAGPGLEDAAAGVAVVGRAWAVPGAAPTGCGAAAAPEPHPAMTQAAASTPAARSPGLGMQRSMRCLTSRLSTTLSPGMKKT